MLFIDPFSNVKEHFLHWNTENEFGTLKWKLLEGFDQSLYKQRAKILALFPDMFLPYLQAKSKITYFYKNLH